MTLTPCMPKNAQVYLYYFDECIIFPCHMHRYNNYSVAKEPSTQPAHDIAIIERQGDEALAQVYSPAKGKFLC